MREFAAIVVLALTVCAGWADEPKVDALGDPLPAFARLRLGTNRFQHGSPIRSLKLVADGKVLVSSSDADQTVRRWESSSGREMGLLNLPGKGEPRSCSISPDGRIAAFRERNGALQLWDMAARKPIRKLTAGDFQLDEPAFAPDGKIVAALPAFRGGGRMPGIRMWDVASGKPQPAISWNVQGLGPLLDAFLFSPDGKCLAASDGAGSVFLWDRTAGKAIEVEEQQDAAHEIAFSPDGKLLAQLQAVHLGQEEKDAKPIYKVRLTSTATGKKVRDLGGLDTDASGLIFSADGSVLATVDRNGVHRWWVATGKELSVVSVQDVTGIALSPDSRYLALSRKGRVIELRDNATGKKLHEWKRKAAQPEEEQEESRLESSLLFARDGKVLMAADGPVVRRWDLAGGKEIYATDGGTEAIRSAAVTDDGRRLATIAADRTIRLWDLAAGKLNRTIPAPASAFPESLITVVRVVFAPDGKCLAAIRGDRYLTIHDASTGRLLHCFQGQAPIVSMAFLPNGRGIVSGDCEGRVVLWDLDAGRPRHLFAGPPLPDPEDVAPAELPIYPAQVAVSPDGRTLAATVWVDGEARIQLWEIATRKFRRSIRLPRAKSPEDPEQPARPVGQLAFAPDGRSLALVRGDHVILFDITSGRECRRFGSLGNPLREVAFSPNGRLLAAAAEDGTILLWDVATGTAKGELLGHRGPATSVAFLPDGRGLVSAGTDSTALVWDTAAYVASLYAPGAKPGEGVLRSWWKELAVADPTRSDEAANRLADFPKEAVALIRAELPPAPPVDTERIARLVNQLESNRFAERRQATRELQKLGQVAKPALRSRLAGNPPLEARQRIEQLLEIFAGPVTDPARLRAQRAVALLERLGTPEARAALQTLAEGPKEAPLTRNASAALDRLAKLTKP